MNEDLNTILEDIESYLNLNEGSYEVWTEFLKKRRVDRENAKKSEDLLLKSIISSGNNEFSTDLEAMYGDFLNNKKEK